MKHYNRLFASAFSLALLLTLSSWVNMPGPTMQENSFKINGDIFKNQSLLFDIKAHEFEKNYYARGTYNYNEEYENMSIEISGGNKILSTSPITGIKIDFNKFRGKGIYTLDSSMSFFLFFKKDIPTADYDYHYVLDSDAKVVINNYEGIGGLIEGTYSGTFNKIIFDKKTGTYTDTDITVSITDGKFSVIHYPDFHWDAPRSTGGEPVDSKKEVKEHRNKEAKKKKEL